MNHAQHQAGRLGRPLKFGRPSRLTTLTLPDDVLEWLGTIHSDPGWAIVSLFDRRKAAKQETRHGFSAAELVHLTPRQALILVNPTIFQRVRGITLLPLAKGRAIVAFESGRGFADLEVAIVDMLEDEGTPEKVREELARVRRQLKEWRGTSALRFTSKSIILVEKRRRRSVRG